MKKLLVILTLFTRAALGQVDSMKNVADSFSTGIVSKLDSAKSSVDHQLDSIQGSFDKQVDSLKQSYASAKGKIESAKAKYLQKIDSLGKLNLSTDKYTGKLDSLHNELTQAQQKVAAKVDALKGKVTEKIKSLNLPPEASAKVGEITSSLNKINLPSIDADVSSKLGLGSLNGALPAAGVGASLPNANLPTGPNTNLPGVNVPTLNTPNLGIQENLGQVNTITGKAGDVQSQVKELATVEGAGKAIEGKVSDLDQVKAIQEQSGLPMQAPADEEAAKKQLMELAQKEAVNHFAGKGAELQQAMDKMSKYKDKYESVQSIKDLPKKTSNPLKGTPFVDRLVPELSLQMLMKDNFMMDISPGVGYRFTGRLTVGAGWNQRASFKSGKSSDQTNVYGPRIFGECKVFKGISGRIELETMNTFVPQNLTITDAGKREWVPAILLGMKQEYPIYKNLKGTAVVLYNFYNPDYKSPYGDRLNARIGFKYVIKKKVKQPVSNKK